MNVLLRISIGSCDGFSVRIALTIPFATQSLSVLNRLELPLILPVLPVLPSRPSVDEFPDMTYFLTREIQQYGKVS